MMMAKVDGRTVASPRNDRRPEVASTEIPAGIAAQE
jgi:hypothetical protein